MRSYFITGTDTGTGKTRVTLALMTAFKQLGLQVMGMKPVATGCMRTVDGLRNPDAERIRSCCGQQAPYKLVNPCAFEAPIAPLFAARADRARIDITGIEQAFRQLAVRADTVIVEGVGGWRMLLGTEVQLSDVVRSLQLQVILVTGLRLGCINHALLSAQAIRSDGLTLAGWVANQIDPEYRAVDQTLELLSAEIRAPLLGVLPYCVDDDCTLSASYLYRRALELLAASV